MKRFVFSLVSLLMLLSPLHASSPAKAFGSYLSGVIKDADYDSRNFPDRLLRLDSRKVMLETGASYQSSYGFDIIPLRGNFLTRHTLSTRSYQRKYEQNSINSSRVYEYDSKSISAGNYCAFKVVGIPLGLAIGASRRKSKQNEHELSSPFNYAYKSKEKDRDSGSIGLGFTVSTSFYSNSPTSIAFEYAEYSSERDETINESRIYNQSYSNKDFISNILIDHKTESTEFGIQFLHDFGSSQKYRLTGSMQYKSVKINEFESESETILEDDDLDSVDTIDFSSRKDSEDVEIYTVEIGISKTITKNNFKFYLAFSSRLYNNCISSNRVDSNHYLEFENDAIYVEEYITTKKLDDNNFYLTMENPLGMSYDVTEWFTLYASINSILRYSKINPKDDRGVDLEGWSNKIGQRICIEFRPISNLEVGIYSISNLKDYKNLELDISYFF